MSRRIMGKASFVELQDSRGRIQVYISRDDICPATTRSCTTPYSKNCLDIGDFIGVNGFVFRTRTGEITVHARQPHCAEQITAPAADREDEGRRGL